MTMADEPADDDALGDVFGSDRDDRGGKETAPEPAAAETGLARDERGRFAAKSQEPPTEGQPPPADTQQQQAQPEQQPPPDTGANHLIPRSELLAERKKRQELERLHMEAEARAKAYEQLQMQQQRHVPPPQPQQQIEPPDPFADPEGYFRHVQQQFQTQLINQRLDTSELLARRHYGTQVVDEAFQAAQQAGEIGRFIREPDPYGALVEWHRKQKVLAEVGDDPQAYRKRLEEEVRQKVLEELKAGGAQGQTQQRFPGTLANATPTGPQGAVLTDEAMMSDIYGSGRRNRRS